MSHPYNSYSNPQSYLSKKRMEPLPDIPKKDYDYPEDKYNHYDGRYDTKYRSQNCK